MGRKGNRLSNRPVAAPTQRKGRVGLPPWRTDCHSQCAHWLRNDATRNRLTRRCVLLPTFPAGGKVGRRRPFPTKEKHPSERKRKPAKRERIPTTSLRTGLGMTGLAYERIFQQPNKVYTSLHGVIARKPPKRRLWRMKRGGFEEVSRFSRHNVAGKRLTRR